jgi:hypothetical protein
MMLTKIAALIVSLATAYIGSLPTTPDNAVAIYPTGGYDPDLTGSKYREPTFQIRVRNTVYATGYALALSIAALLHGTTNSDFLLIAQQGDVLDMGRDASNRSEFSINFRCYYK